MTNEFKCTHSKNNVLKIGVLECNGIRYPFFEGRTACETQEYFKELLNNYAVIEPSDSNSENPDALKFESKLNE